METAGLSGLSLMTWQGWGVLSVIAALTVLLATILAWLLPFPDRSLSNQLDDYAGRMALRARLGGEPVFETYLLTMRRFSEWLSEWFGPPFSAQAYERNLALAFIFPIALFLLALIANGLASGRISSGELGIFALAAIVIASVISSAFSNLLGLVERGWQMFGGDKDMARTISRVLLGAFAMMVAFAIAFSIASTFSGVASTAGAVLGAMAGGFALAFALAVAFALAGAAMFAVVVAIVGGAALAFASQFAFLLFLFFVIIPVVNASIDWLCWGLTRLMMSSIHDVRPKGAGLTAVAALTLGSFLTGCVFLVALAALLPNAIEGLNAAFAALELPVFDWRAMVAAAVRAPWSEGLFVTGMLLTTMIPAAAHLVTGVAGALARFSPAARTAAATLSHVPDGLPSPADLGPIKLMIILSRVWYLIAITAVLGLIAGGGYLISLLYGPAAGLLQEVALCSTAWSHGTCAWF
jgi:hypothetical protein